jgi:transposase-like protein
VTLTIADTRGLWPDDGVVSSFGGPRSDQPRRRVFSAEYKLKMVAAYDRATEPGERGALLRREGLYHSHIIEWRKARDAGTLQARQAAGETPDVQQGEQEGQRPATARRRRGRPSAEQAEVERLRRQNEKLARDLARAQAALEVMGKAHALLELLSESAEQTREPGSSR